MSNKTLSLLVPLFMTISTAAFGQVANDADGNFDSTSYVETDSTTNTTTNSTVNSTSNNTNTSTIDSTNTNTNVNTNTSTVNSTATNTNNNTNVNTNTNNNTNTNTNNSTVNSTSTNTNTNNNILSGGTNNTNTNTNTNNSTINSTTNSTIDQTVNSTSNNTNTNTNTNTNANTNTNDTTVNSTANNTNTNNNNNDSNIKQEIVTAPPSAIAPTVMTGGNDTCTVTFSASVQTQILGASGGGHIRDLNCERLKNSKTLYNMGMKVAAVSLMCQDPSVYKAMQMAGTPCPFNGTIGGEAQTLWDENVEMQPSVIEQETRRNDKMDGAVLGAGSILLLLLLL